MRGSTAAWCRIAPREKSSRPAERLLFDLPRGETPDLDEAMIGESMMRQAAEKAKDVLGPERD